MGSPWWGKLLIVAACSIAGCLLLIGAKRELFDHKSTASSNTSQSIQAAPTSEPTFSDVAGVNRPARAAATPIRAQRVRAAKATPTPRPDRQDCDALRGVHDRTRSERLWFIDNCLYLSRKKPQPAQEWTAQLQAAGFSLAQPTPHRSAIEAESTPPPSLTRQVAISDASDWITNDSPMMLTIEPEGCTAIWLNGHWVVTCPVRLVGCQGTFCVASLSLCVFASDPAIVPDSLC